jgi:AbrB family looped-hinge helix DNA binding protein
MSIHVITHIDSLGRVVIPKPIRDHLGLKTGSKLCIEEVRKGIVLKIMDQTSYVTKKDGIAVYTSPALSDIEDAIKQEREKRIKDLGGY